MCLHKSSIRLVVCNTNICVSRAEHNKRRKEPLDLCYFIDLFEAYQISDLQVLYMYCYMYVYMFCKNELQAKLFVLFTLYLSNNTIVVSVKVLETNLLCAPVHGVETINVV